MAVVDCTCCRCGSDFVAGKSDAKYCGLACRKGAVADQQRARRASRPPRERVLNALVCEWCGASFTGGRSRFCSPSHRSSAWARDNPGRKVHRPRFEPARACVECGLEFRAPRERSRFCSHTCRAREYRRRNAEACRRRGREWASQNPEGGRVWRSANKAKVRDAQRAHYERMMEKAPAVMRQRFREAAARRRAALACVPVVPFTAEQLQARFAIFAGCWICGDPSAPLEADHVKPIAKGGPHMLSNLRPACRPCNASKKDRWFGVAGLGSYAGGV